LRRPNNQRRNFHPDGINNNNDDNDSNEGIHGNDGNDADADADADADDDDDDTDDGVYSVSTVSFHTDDESIDSFDSLFRRADFPRIIADLDVIRQNGRIRNEDGTYIDIEEPEQFVFTERDIRANIRHYPDSFLRRYFQEPWPNLH
jgi:hypothetical protein